MKLSFKSIIVDDEELAREDLKALLKDFGEIEIVGEAETAEDAKTLIKKVDPDLIFLDIQMPGKSGFEMLEDIQTNARIIFVTAYDEFAIRAFEVNAKDYLLKPVNKERLSRAIERLKTEQEIENNIQSKLLFTDSIFLSVNNHYRFIKISSIIKIISAGNYSEIYTSSKIKGLVLKTLKEWETRLPSNYFIRIHRNAMINLEFVDHVEGWFNYSYKVFLKEIDDPLVMSRRYAARLKDRMI
ncbi:MAG: response regulator [Ignavibacteriaceae bacterium]|nr:response regulator [Ignavibacteriaceae bacterium]MCW8817432.1 response regulator [Ignavibacteriaceae bacterium]MCW8823448.1 response regulator [Ignavibacteriaceae bacterium]MCW9094326.1 response regulator [Ignavibacteriaceae bacterium]